MVRLKEVRNPLDQVGILVLFCCPNCREVNAVSSHISTIDHLGRVIPDFICGIRSCRFHSEVYLDQYHKKTLYALALENGKTIELRYTHANNVAEASRGIDVRKWRVIGIGPAIGYHV